MMIKNCKQEVGVRVDSEQNLLLLKKEEKLSLNLNHKIQVM